MQVFACGHRVLGSLKPLCSQLSYTIPTQYPVVNFAIATKSLAPEVRCQNLLPGVFQIELFHDQLPLAVPCYDLVPVTELTLGPTYVETSGTPGSLDLTGGEYKT